MPRGGSKGPRKFSTERTWIGIPRAVLTLVAKIKEGRPRGDLRCARCKEDLTPDAFPRDRSAKCLRVRGGRGYYCTGCVEVRSKSYWRTLTPTKRTAKLEAIRKMEWWKTEKGRRSRREVSRAFRVKRTQEAKRRKGKDVAA